MKSDYDIFPDWNSVLLFITVLFALPFIALYVLIKNEKQKIKKIYQIVDKLCLFIIKILK